MSMNPLLRRRYRLDETLVPFTLNGTAQTGRRGDTVLTAILSVSGRLRQSEFTGENRAGFCLIGACQDCYVMTAQGSRVRACSTALLAGMAFITDLGAVSETAHD
ncbi:(2Fe-2S)-binding protein [Ensifer adhaerens]|jgi:hypothetical protein|uniref:(2Fe-2S)-binding protein n=2 Tax=Sinorhizobium/Ensifer group TaxID=227292 RepID=A0A9Q9DDC9_ENSAD|nr:MULTISPECIES: (2Fe-2S)-binding protein [Ensifer]KSV67037.1 hypothetical protein N185_31130 [Sinorhizobium sp. GW3]KSV77133.1 hypothetical protein N182_23790 [Sinorhizobium sp. GL2]MBD9558856.1 (2Fe-2S)-binding protein [Ensifer sp. ENS03]MBD9596826.1 (2Fe-2S)-binding protein [Ensifer sp. ENS05]MBD9627633.1 (2Fe-2S)-binding protein [Ensifer sp. ENS06]OWZ91139.1 ferredoxin [Sinorhizobium sp. LM21]